jgi:t-SNARE complex subunit (syntaxin)
VPPLAQLKVLRALQAELNERTVQFAKDHPDADKLNAEEKAELADLERSQREIAALFELMAQKVQKKPDPNKDAPAPEKQ